MSYYTSEKSKKGSLNISDYVFSQIARETLNNLCETKLKDKIVFKDDKTSVITKIENNKIKVEIRIFSLRNSDVQNSVNTIQSDVYDALYEASEIASIKVNVTVAGFVDNK